VDELNKVTGVEVLARWSNEKFGEISPEEFIHIAEQTGLIIEVGNYIIESAFKTFKDWHERGIVLERMSINLSVRQFTHHNFVNDIKNLCAKYLNEDTVSRIVFEITESIMAEGLNIVEIINELKKLGIKFSMDDFGTGYSSLSYVRQLPIDEIKIDRHFVKELSLHKNAEEMVDTILHIAKIFNMIVVAEGVETEKQREFLMSHGCKIFQGFLYSHAVSKDNFEHYYFDHK